MTERADHQSSESEDETADTGQNNWELRIEQPIDSDTTTPDVASSSDVASGSDVHCNFTWDLLDQNQYCSSDSESETSPTSAQPLESELALWVNEYQVKHNAVDSLLRVLQKHGHSDLPSTARTLLGSATEVITEIRSGMDYIYFGVQTEIVKHFRSYPLDYRNSIEKLEVSLNIDGLPLFTSSKRTVWPILCGLMLKPMKIFPLALLCGETKPANLDFLQETVNDLGLLIQNGLECDERTIQVVVKCIVCDAPARALVKNIKQYSGYFGCERCTQKGSWVGRMTFPETQNLQLRTDTSFRNQIQHEHHHGNSPFTDLPIDMINTFPVDYMHQACLGVMRRLLLLWIRGPRVVKLSAGQVGEISIRLKDLKSSIPQSFARKPRGLDVIDRWKATELRQFMLYTGKLVLKDILRRELYNHFMVFSIAMCILVCPQTAVVYNTYAHDLLVYFVEQGHNLYGPEFLVYNIHSLLHISYDARTYKTLDSCSAFPFENYLHYLKRLVRSGRHPLVQIVKRLGELDKFKSVEKEISLSQKISTKRPNNAYILSNSSCCEVVDTSREVDENQRQKYLCRVYERVVPLFNNPCDSSIIGALKAHRQISSMKLLSESTLQRKAIIIDNQVGTDIIFLAVLHTF